jgi:hypothetical protein
MLTKSPLIAVLGTGLGLVVLAYFAFMTWKSPALARILLRRGHGADDWSEQRLTTRLRVLGVAGMSVSAAAILLAITRF